MAGKQFGHIAEYRSDSDNGRYLASVERALATPKAFSRFKQDPDYQAILEHVSEQQGREYLEIVRKQAPDLLARLDDFRKNDLLGSPTRFTYEGLAPISPTTLRYLKVLSDLRQLFGSLDGAEVAEIGGGYGGQMLLVDELFDIRRYTIFDLPPVLALVRQYLEGHLLKSSYATTTLNAHAPGAGFDLVISNYAFSELPRAVQEVYLKKVISRAARGYLTMNSGVGLSSHDHGKLTLEAIREFLPPVEIFQEQPLTGPGGYVIVWGHSAPLSY